MADFDADKCSAIDERVLDEYESEEDEEPVEEEWYGPERCGFCGAAQAKLINAHLRIVEGVRLYWKISGGRMRKGSPPSGGSASHSALQLTERSPRRLSVDRALTCA